MPTLSPVRAALAMLCVAQVALSEPPVIPEGPVTIDPAQFLPEPLRRYGHS